MELRNYHTHTTFCDGQNTVEEMAAAAAALGMRALGFSGHSYTFYDTRYCMAREDLPGYAAAVRAAQSQYRGRMEIYLGVEDDFHGDRPDFPRDYTIGSVHCVLAGGVHYEVDNTQAELERAIREGFGGDVFALTAAYFADVARVLDVTRCDFVGHFDLVTKFNEGGRRFDEEDPRYWKPALEALEHLCAQGAVFEINTGAMARGYRTAPYPAPRLLRAIHELGGAVILSSDAHSAGRLCAHFPEAAALAMRCGFRTCRILTPRGWEDTPLEA